MTEQSAATELQQGQAQPPKPRSRTLASSVMAVAGGVLTAGALFLISNNTSTGDSSNLSIVAASDIPAATETLDPATSGQLAAGAKNCTVPLAYVRITKRPDAAGGVIRIRSGNYVSPPFQMTDAPQQVAIPYPAPYPTGHGTISIEGNASGALVSLYPTWNVETVSGSAARNVIWKPGNPCQ